MHACLRYRVRPAALFVIDDVGQLWASEALVEATYTMAVVASRESQSDVALVVVYVQDSPASPLASSAETNRTTIVIVAAVCAVLLLILIVVIAAFIVKYRRLVVRSS